MEKLLIRGGRVIDPANGVDKVADVLIADGKIAAVGFITVGAIKVKPAPGVPDPWAETAPPSGAPSHEPEPKDPPA